MAATAYTVGNPAGDVIGTGAPGAAFSDDIGFTITAGGTAFVAGDGFDVAVALGAGKYKPLTPGATDGSEIATAIAYAVGAGLNGRTDDAPIAAQPDGTLRNGATSGATKSDLGSAEAARNA